VELNSCLVLEIKTGKVTTDRNNGSKKKIVLAMSLSVKRIKDRNSYKK
jgi:hypothetical protein